MKLKECYIENFGKICKQKFTFTDGFNSFLDDNGAGKTTLSVFIKVMLYGMSDTKKTLLSENDRKHYLPWNEGPCRGYLTFLAGDRCYRVERSFAKQAGADTFALYDEDTGNPSQDFSQDLGEELFGIDADGFERTVFLSERSLSPKSDNRSISAKLSDLVGSDGDIGGLDGAVKLLEDERKFLYKKGGSGKISDISSAIDEHSRRLREIADAEKLGRELLEDKSALSQRLDLLLANISTLKQERTAAERYEAFSEYAGGKDALDKEISELEAQRAELLELFGNRIPSSEEIDSIRDKLAVAQRLEEKSTASTPELDELSVLFDNNVSEGEISSVRAALSSYEKQKRLFSSERAEKTRQVFQGRLPSQNEIDEHIARESDPSFGKKSNSPKLLCGMLLLVLALLSAVFIPRPYGFIAAAVMIAASAVLAFYIYKGNANENKRCTEQTADFIKGVSGITAQREEILKLLIEMRSLREGAENYLDRSAELESAEVLISFVSKFPMQSSAMSLEETAAHLISKYEKYSVLSMAREHSVGRDARNRDEAKLLKREAELFLSRFKLRTAEPLTELRSALAKYGALTAALAAKRTEKEKLASSAAASGPVPKRSSAEISAQIKELEGEQDRVSRELGSLSVRISGSMEKIDERDMISAAREELCERLAEYEARLKTVLKTKELLEKAKDSLTSKYIGKTRSGFEKYSLLISGEKNEFSMATDFGVSRLDGGVLRKEEAYSKGTRDLYSIAARFALIDSLYENETPFVVLDDPFANLDDKKISRALELLKKLSAERQIIYFTCSRSRT